MLCWHSLPPVQKNVNPEKYIEAYQIGCLTELGFDQLEVRSCDHQNKWQDA